MDRVFLKPLEFTEFLQLVAFRLVLGYREHNLSKLLLKVDKTKICHCRRSETRDLLVPFWMAFWFRCQTRADPIFVYIFL